MRKTYEFKIAKEHKWTVAAVMNTLGIRRYSMLVDEDYNIIVNFKANKKELNKVIFILNKYANVKAYVA